MMDLASVGIVAPDVRVGSGRGGGIAHSHPTRTPVSRVPLDGVYDATNAGFYASPRSAWVHCEPFYWNLYYIFILYIECWGTTRLRRR